MFAARCQVAGWTEAAQGAQVPTAREVPAVMSTLQEPEEARVPLNQRSNSIICFQVFPVITVALLRNKSV